VATIAITKPEITKKIIIVPILRNSFVPIDHVFICSPRASPGAAPQQMQPPAVVRKVDPKYPPTLIAEHVEGEVILYAVIRRDGSVDSIQVARGIDSQLDSNAMRALAQWKFKPAERNGAPVDLEAIVHIPFHAPRRD
jgi:protein TonB